MAVPPALSNAQETRLIIYLDEQLSSLQRNYEARHSSAAILPTITSYLTALLTLHNLILSIPPTPPSASLRTAYYLTLTGLLPDALSGYPIPDDSLPAIWTALRRFDRGWVIVLRGDNWNAQGSAAGASRGSSPAPPFAETAAGGGGGGLTWTDRVRLSSLISEVRSTLATALGLPMHGGEGRKEYNPRGEVIEPRLKPLEVEMSNGEEGQGEPGALDLEHRYVVEEQEDRAEDEEGGMDVDDEDEVRIVEEGEDSDEDDFEEVDVSPEPLPQQPGSPLSPSAQPHESFSVSFHATPPPPISADVEEALREEPPAAQDPDDEYGLDVEGEEDEVDRGVKVESEKVFQGAIAELKRMGGANAS